MHISTVPYTHSIFERKSSQSDALVSENHFQSSTQCSWFSINYCFKFFRCLAKFGSWVQLWTVSVNNVDRLSINLHRYELMCLTVNLDDWIMVTLSNNVVEFVFYIEKRGCRAIAKELPNAIHIPVPVYLNTNVLLI
jgi:hypothetical protein